MVQTTLAWILRLRLKERLSCEVSDGKTNLQLDDIPLGKVGKNMRRGIQMDRISEMEAFIKVVEMGSFTDAGRELGISKSAVSKCISALEAQLGAQILKRTTRRVNPTQFGLSYYDRARQVLTTLQEAETMVSSMHANPSGLLRVSVARDFGINCLSPIIGSFLDEFPDITLELVFDNRFVELNAESFDMALRIDQLDDSVQPTCKIAQTTNRMVASPDYLRQYGRPKRIDDLNKHRLLHYSSASRTAVWRLTAPTGEKRQVRKSGGLIINDGQSLLNAAISGLGIAYLPSFLSAKAMAEGLVEDVIPDLPVEIQGIYAIYSEGCFIDPKRSAFTDFLVSQFAGKGPLDW